MWPRRRDGAIFHSDPNAIMSSRQRTRPIVYKMHSEPLCCFVWNEPRRQIIFTAEGQMLKRRLAIPNVC